MRLTSQAFHASYFLPLLKTGVTFAFLQSFVASPSYNGWSKIIMSDTAVIRASSALVDANQSDYGHRCPLFSHDLIFFHQGYTLLSPSWWKSGFLKAGLASKDCAKEAFITSASSVSCAIQRPPVSFSNGPRWSLVFPLLPILLSLIPKKILSGLQLSWLQPWMVRQCPSILPRLHCSHSLYAGFVFVYNLELLVHSCRPSSYWFIFAQVPIHWDGSWTCKNVNQLSGFLELSLPSRPLSYTTFPSRSLKWSNSTLLKPRVVSFLSDLFLLLLRMLNSNISLLLYQVCLQFWHVKQVPPSLWGIAKLLSPKSYLRREMFSSLHSRALLHCFCWCFKILKTKNSFLQNTFMNTFYSLGLLPQDILIVFIYSPQKNIFPCTVTQYCSSPIILPLEYISHY